MKLVSKYDYLQVIQASLIADYDRLTITNLYQPIIGHEAVSLYFALWGESQNQKITPLISHEFFFMKTGFSANSFVEARKTLEASGLLRTYVSENKGVAIYRYEVYAPKTPMAFFNDVLLCGVLINEIGEENVNKLKQLYASNIHANPGEKEITASFVEVFNTNLDNPSFDKALKGNNKNLIGRTKGRINKDFSYEDFFTELASISQISSDSLSKKDMKEIARLATLYGADENVAAIVVDKVYNPNAKRNEKLDYNELVKVFINETSFAFVKTRKNQRKSLVNSTTDLGRKINMFETMDPKRFLSELQNHVEPSVPDLMLINDISKKFGLPNPVINALVDYVLTVNNNVLSRSYCEKVAGSLVRENVQTGLEAMEYLKKVYKGKSEAKKNKAPKGEEEIKETKVEQEEESEGISWDEFFDEMEADNGKD